MNMSRTTVVLILLGLVIAAAVGYLLFGRTETGGVAMPEDAPASAAELTFIGLTARIDPVSFDTKILTDERFIALKDIRTAVIPEAKGRTDPFGQLGR